ncbi:type II toxin-antitoxin system HicA family toxin [Sandarakinorhabdus sp.]|uniref:type II toxin-antitoxin system HicA family toxin n=1 Tax=Sandarakinorhabdus sp. TaxID=1916663 RepID=UPI003F704DF7
MNSRHSKTLAALHRQPTAANIEWAAIEALLLAVGCQLVEGSGSRVRFVKDAMVETFHRPHPEKEAKRYQVRAARDYLARLGVTP